jgi:hypothetical protein
MKKVLKLFLALLVASTIMTSCGNSFDKLSKDDLKKNEEFILKDVYQEFFYTKEYINGMKMNPPMQFDAVYIYCLNINDKSINFNALEKEGYEIEWDDYKIDNLDIKEMLENNIPIVQMSFHWWDPMSETGNNKWVTKTYFFPECKMKNNSLDLGNRYASKARVQSIQYFPYFYEKFMDAPISDGKWLDLKNLANDCKVNFNGSIYKISDLLKKVKSDKNSKTTSTN